MYTAKKCLSENLILLEDIRFTTTVRSSKIPNRNTINQTFTEGPHGVTAHRRDLLMGDMMRREREMIRRCTTTTGRE